ncbi:hypothetical protein KHA80_07450 [Anaerobacillus sp. HL2]|nr:hypothetical protein KHA80_07450 [Anaerobacillus sp. HL2]
MAVSNVFTCSNVEFNVKRDKVVTIEISWSRPGGFTWLFEAEVMQLMKEMPVAKR